MPISIFTNNIKYNNRFNAYCTPLHKYSNAFISDRSVCKKPIQKLLICPILTAKIKHSILEPVYFLSQSLFMKISNKKIHKHSYYLFQINIVVCRNFVHFCLLRCAPELRLATVP